MKLKIVAIDLDGTLLTGSKTITKENYEAIKYLKKKKIYPVVATGRPLCGCLPTLNHLDLFKKENYLICFNGAKVINLKTNEIIYSSYLKLEDFKKIYYLSKKFKTNFHAFRFDDEALLCDNINPYTLVESEINNIKITPFNINEITDNKFIKVMIVDSENNLNIIEQNIPNEFKEKYNIVRSSKIFLEFLNKNCNKGIAVQKLAEHLGLTMDNVMSIGDAGNDLHMIETSKIGCCMANGYEYVKEKADYVTQNDMNNSGVAECINKYVVSKAYKNI